MPSLKTHVPEPTVKIWHILEGPFGFDDMPEEYWPFVDNYGTPLDGYEGCVYLLAKIECDGVISDVDYWFDSFDAAYEVVNKLKTQIEPVVLEK